MSGPAVSIKCSDPACDVASSGDCIDGKVPPDTCPKYGRAAIEDLGESTAKAAAPGVKLRNGRALRGASAIDQILRKRPARFISILGDKDAGKTTLITAIYDRLFSGPFAGLEFAGSETLVEFEVKTYYSRVDSGRPHPSTPRTSRQDGLLYYHLAVSSAAHRTDFLFSDRAGEVYSDARNNADEVAALMEVPQADRVIILVDGKKLARLDSRADAFQGPRQLLRVLLDNGALTASSRVQIVVTKADKIQTAMDSAALEKAIGEFETRLSRDFGTRLGSLTYWRIAARDPNGRLAPALGVAELVKEWVTELPELEIVALPLARVPTSEFDLLMERTVVSQ